MSAVLVHRLDASGVAAYRAGIREVYAAAFGAPPWHEPADRADAYLRRLARDADRPGFAAAVATDRAGGGVLGFVTAWTTPAPFPGDRCYPLVSERLGQRRTAQWLCGAREIDELAVHPGAGRRGVGAALLDAVGDDAPDGRSWLLTAAVPGGPLPFYLRRGWRQVTEPAPGPDGLVVLLGPRHPAVPDIRAA
ncbi:GNAT family N-acetyltransferase [Kitasatospora sp. NPDC048365]|uniref:GNAT family N-acetyltransferase n=1 Tax=Kitasatospora sp. NPDC048365 TaxID=3364050 RepID=UPI0037219100